jgi:general nucleoside transport system permease protein
MLPRLEARGAISTPMLYLTPVFAVVLTLISGVILFAALGFDPLRALYVYFIKPVSTVYGLSELAVKATPLALTATGLALGFRANVWNIGAEGQLTIGAITGGAVALFFQDSQGIWILPLMIVAGAAGGAAWAAIPAWLRVRFNANEILTSLMLTYVATLLLSYLVHGVMRDPQGFNFPQSKMFSDYALLPVILEGTRLNIGAFVAIGVIAVGWVLVSRSFIGFQIKVVGQAPTAAGYAGFSEKRLIWFTFLFCGALAGMAGLFEVAGPIGQLTPVISPGYGFTAIIVAFLGRLHPVGVLLASLLIALSYIGGELAQIELRLPLAVTGVFQGMLLFFLLGTDVLIRYRFRFRRGAPASRTVPVEG